VIYAALFSIAGLVFAVHSHVDAHNAKAISAALVGFVQNHANLISFPLFCIVLFASIKGWLPGTKPAETHADIAGAPPEWRFSDALALIVYFVVIQTGLGLLQGAVCEAIGLPYLAQMPVARCTLGVLSSIFLALFAMECSRTPAAGLFTISKVDFLIVPILLFIVFGSVLIESEIDNMQRALFSYPGIMQQMLNDMMNQGLLSVFLLVVIAPVAEELVFRGIILKSLLNRHSATRAIILSAIVFTCVHMDPLQMLPALGSGLLLGWLYYETGSLWMCILLHSSHNLMTYLVYHNHLPFRLPGFSLTGMSVEKYQFQPVWLDCLGIVLLAIGIMAVRAVVNRKDSAEES
jgi:membrane protease YdiL (CAAX protease family)